MKAARTITLLVALGILATLAFAKPDHPRVPDECTFERGRTTCVEVLSTHTFIANRLPTFCTPAGTQGYTVVVNTITNSRTSVYAGVSSQLLDAFTTSTTETFSYSEQVENGCERSLP